MAKTKFMDLITEARQRVKEELDFKLALQRKIYALAIHRALGVGKGRMKLVDTHAEQIMQEFINNNFDLKYAIHVMDEELAKVYDAEGGIINHD